MRAFLFAVNRLLMLHDCHQITYATILIILIANMCQLNTIYTVDICSSENALSDLSDGEEVDDIWNFSGDAFYQIVNCKYMS